MFLCFLLNHTIGLWKCPTSTKHFMLSDKTGHAVGIWQRRHSCGCRMPHKILWINRFYILKILYIYIYLRVWSWFFACFCIFPLCKSFRIFLGLGSTHHPMICNGIRRASVELSHHEKEYLAHNGAKGCSLVTKLEAVLE